MPLCYPSSLSQSNVEKNKQVFLSSANTSTETANNKKNLFASQGKGISLLIFLSLACCYEKEDTKISLPVPIHFACIALCKLCLLVVQCPKQIVQ